MSYVHAPVVLFRFERKSVKPYVIDNMPQGQFCHPQTYFMWDGPVLKSNIEI